MSAFAPLLAAPACTLVVDRNAAQCKTDDDCHDFGGHPYCQKIDRQTNAMKSCAGADDCICVPSGLQPKECVSPPLVNPDDFLNGCSLGALPGNNTGPLGVCLSYNNGATNPDAGAKDPLSFPPPPATDGGIPVPLVACKDVAPGGSVVYMSGSSNFPPLLKKIAPAISKSLAAQGLQPIAPVFKTTTSCAGVQAIYPVQPATTPVTYYPARTIRDLANAADNYPQYFDPATGNLANCTLGPNGATVDIGESEIFPETCANPGMAGTNMIRNEIEIAQADGPKLAILFVVPDDSDQTVISSEAAREVFSAGSLEPWSEPSLFYIRGAGTATQQLVGHAIGVASNKFWGRDLGTAEALAFNLGNIFGDAARKAIGILGADFYDTNRGRLQALGFQATDQLCAYTPDSNSTLEAAPRDKINVRDGHYPIWGAIHLFNARAGGQAPAAVNYFVSLFAQPRLPMEMLDAFIDASVVPDCAMMVKREGELGPLRSEPPVVACGCYFDSHVNPGPNPPPGCTKCSADLPCADPKRLVCNYGFCEVR